MDYEVVDALHGAVPEDALLQVMDANKADWGQAGFKGKSEVHPAALWWFAGSNSSLQAQSFMHKTRCASGINGSHVRASSQPVGANYLKCSPPLCASIGIGKEFAFPPPLCQETCDQDAACVGYVVDGGGTRCWVLVRGQCPVGTTTYTRISD
jgi:hypothetical protein